MSENKPGSKTEELGPFDALVAGIKISQERQKVEGETPFPTPEVDKYIEKNKEEARK